MVFSSLTFLCIFLPVTLLLYRLMPSTAAKNVLLLAASLVFYAYGEPVYVLLMLASAEVRDYVVIHELCHRLQMNHSAKFWSTVACYCPDYKLQRKWLRDNGPILIQR